MAPRKWIGLYSRNKAGDVSSDLEREYQAALLIKSLRLEYYGECCFRPELELSVPRSVKATILRKFVSLLEFCFSLFIATFPVILAKIFKYWIFRYLNRLSPFSVATLKGISG